MTTDKDNVKLELNIAGETMLITVPFSKKGNVKKCENEINRKFSEWRVKYPKKNPSELLAMLAFNYASYYLELQSRLDNLSVALEATSSSLSHILRENDGPADADNAADSNIDGEYYREDESR